MKKWWLILLISYATFCQQNPYQHVIYNLKNLKVIDEEAAYPYSHCYRLLGLKDHLEYRLLLNCWGTELTGNIFIPKQNLFYELVGKIDVTGAFIANIYSTKKQWIDTLKGYFVQDEIKCAFSQNYENLLIGKQWKNNVIPLKLYSLKLTGYSENYPFQPKPKLTVHHTYLSIHDTIPNSFQYELSKIFFQKTIFHSDSIYNAMSKEILDYKDRFETNMKNLSSPISVDSLHKKWIKKFEIVYNQDSILSIIYINYRKEGANESSILQPLIYDFRKKRFLNQNDLPAKFQELNIYQFLIYPNFIRVWKSKTEYEDIPLS